MGSGCSSAPNDVPRAPTRSRPVRSRRKVTAMASDLRSPRQWTAQVVAGVVIVVFGLLLTAGNLGWVDRRQVLGLLHFWPLAISAVGVSRLLAADARSDRIFSGILIFVGVWLTA